MDGPDLELFERSVSHATDTATGAALDAALDELGWRDALRVDAHAAVSVLFENQGRANATSSALGQLMLGEADSAGVVLPPIGQSTPPGRLQGDRLMVAGLAGEGFAQHGQAFIVVRSADADAAVLVPTSALTLRPIDGIDPWLGLREVTADLPAADLPSAPVADWASAVALARVAVGHELVGASRAMLELARQHALERIQFGHPIGSFQAVRHRLADTLVAIETANAVLDAAWLSPSGPDPGTAAMAKALAGRGARTATRHCQQVLAGIGFTTEHSLHRYVRRVQVLDELFGAARTLTTELGDDLLTTRQLPPLLPL